jgi:hypothetical protein
MAFEFIVNKVNHRFPGIAMQKNPGKQAFYKHNTKTADIVV